MTEREWLCEYDYEGSQWNVPGIFARSREEAAAKLRAIGSTGMVRGELIAKGSVSPAAILLFLFGMICGATLILALQAMR